LPEVLVCRKRASRGHEEAGLKTPIGITIERVGNFPPPTVGNFTADRVRFLMISNEIQDDAEIDPAALVVFMRLVRHRDYKSSVCQMGIRRMCEVSRLSAKTVRGALKVLEARGHIRIRGRGTARRSYVLLSPLYRKSVVMESGDQVIEAYVSDGADHLRMLKERPKRERKSA
jgi:hypothetical protein